LNEVAPGESQGETIRLRSGVQRVKRAGSHHLLVPPDGPPVRVGAAIDDDLWGLLVKGARFDDIVVLLQEAHPGSREIRPKLSEFLQQLGRSGLLEGALPAQRQPTPLVAWEVPPLLQSSASPRGRLATILPYGGLIAMAVAGALGYCVLLARGARAWLSVPTLFNLLVALTLLILLHELGHAVAAQLAGTRLGRIGIRRGFLPLPFVETPDVYLINSRLKRFSIAAGGPVSDLVFGGAAAWALLGDETKSPLLSTIASVGLILFSLGTSPLRQGDGSHMLEALLNDDLARKSALSTTPARLSRARDVALYRGACVAHVLLWLVILGVVLTGR